MTLTAPRCPICDSALTRSLFEKTGGEVAGCRQCRHQWLVWPRGGSCEREPHAVSNVTPEETHSMLYGPSILSPRMTRMLKARLKQKAGTRMLDLGCGSGKLMHEMKDTGAQIVGVDSGPWAEVGRRTFGVNILIEDIGSALARFRQEGRRFDVVTLIAVVEHLARPADVLGKAKGVLEEKGVIWVYVPVCDSLCCRLRGANWQQYVIPEHRHFFSRKSMEVLCTKIGLGVRCLATRSHSDVIPIPDGARRWGMWRGVNFLTKRIIQWLGCGDLVLFELQCARS